MTVLHQDPAPGFFGELADDVRSRLSAAGRFESLREGTYLAVQGRVSRMLVHVVSGKLRVTCNTHGDTLMLAELGPGEVVGESSVIDPRPASASVKVIDGPAVVWLIDDTDFERFVADDLGAASAVMKVLAKKLCRRLREDAEALLRREERLRAHFLDMDY